MPRPPKDPPLAPSLVPAQIDALADMVHCPAEKRDWFLAGMGAIHWGYWEMKPIAARTVLGDLKKRYSRLATQTEKLLALMDADLDGFARLVLTLRGSSPPWNDDQTDQRYHRLRADLQFFKQVCNELASAGHRGNQPRLHLIQACEGLVQLYREATGKRCTHNTKREAIDTGKPESPFGRFVVAAFEAIDPSVSEGALRSPIASAVARQDQILEAVNAARSAKIRSV